MLQILPVETQEEWTTFFNQCGSPSFHQAWAWGEFQQNQGYEIERLGLYEDKGLQAIALVVKIRAKRGRFLFVPHGPVSKAQNPQLLLNVYGLLTKHLKKIAHAEGFWFIRLAPSLPATPEHLALFQTLRFRQSPIYMHAETMWALDITKAEDELLADMRKTTRYLIRKAIKDEIKVIEKNDEQSVTDFWEIYQTTFTRENFTPFSRRFISGEFHAFKKSDCSSFLFATPPQKFAQEGQLKYLAGSLVIFTKSTAFYHQGASIHTKFSAPYLLQWEAIRLAKKRGCQTYNFYGIHKPGRTPKTWEGLSLFKKGFGGYQIDYVPTQDYVLSPKYYLSYLYERFLNIKRQV